MNTTTLLIRPLTNNMLEKLMDCHERELMNLEPFDVASLHYPNGLIERGLLETRPYITKSGKKIMAFYVTGAGRRYLSKL